MDSKDYYSSISARYFDETFGEVRSASFVDRAVRTEAVLKIVDRYLTKPSLIADLGCGPAQFAAPLLQRGHRYLGLDVAKEMYRPVASSLTSNSFVSFAAGSVEDIPLLNESVDAALLVGVIEYLHSDDYVLNEVHRVLKPSGIVVVTFPNALNPVVAFRALSRPLLAPLIRRLTPGSRYASTVYASRMVDRALVPRRLIRKAERFGFRMLDACCHGYHIYPFNHELTPGQARRRRMWDHLGSCWLPRFGGDFVLTLGKL